MKAAVYRSSGPPDVLELEEVADPTAGPGTLLVANEAISIEGGDLAHRATGETGGAAYIGGYASAGVVEAVGDGVSRFKPGDRVAVVGMNGSHAELRVVPEGFAWRIPASLGFREAACVPISFGTAADALFEFGRMRPDECVYIQGASGGVGVAAVQIAHRAGARVIASASTPAKRARLIELGAKEVVDSTSPDLVAEVRRLAGGRGVDLILDNVGGSALGEAVGVLAPRGRLVSVGELGRETTTTVDVAVLRERNLSVTGYFMALEMLLDSRVRDVVDDLFCQVAMGDLTVVIDREFPLADAAAAHAYIESRAALGRVVLIP